jgi:hypothetical protein
MREKQSLIKFILIIFMVFTPITNLNADNPKGKLFELLGLSENASVNEELFDLLVEKLEELGIEEENISDGYEFMGGNKAFKTYLNKNATRLVKLMQGVTEVEEKVVDELVQKEDGFLFEKFDAIESSEKK